MNFFSRAEASSELATNAASLFSSVSAAGALRDSRRVSLQESAAQRRNSPTRSRLSVMTDRLWHSSLLIAP